MLSEDLKNVVAPRARILNVMWGAFMAATMIYLAVIRYVSSTPKTGTAGEGFDLNMLVGLFVLVAVGLAAASFVYPRYAFSAERLALAFKAGATARSDGAGAAEAAAARDLAESERHLVGLLPYYQSALIVVWALRESIAVLGVILAILTREIAPAVPFCLAALALVFLARPRPLEFVGQWVGKAGS